MNLGVFSTHVLGVYTGKSTYVTAQNLEAGLFPLVAVLVILDKAFAEVSVCNYTAVEVILGMWI